jgi:dUTP pyrophosphatase
MKFENNKLETDVQDLGVYKIHEDAKLPEYGTTASACFDLCAYIPTGSTVDFFDPTNKKNTIEISDARLILKPNHRYMVPTGIIFDIPQSYHIKVHPRSGQAIKQGLITVNNTGIIDEDYIEECKCLMINISGINISIKNHERIAQAEVCRVEPIWIHEIGDRPTQKTDRDGGFGSTGK